MKQPNRLHPRLIFFGVALILFLVAAGSAQFFKGTSTKTGNRPTPPVATKSAAAPSPEPTTNESPSPEKDKSNSASGTCKVTKNGVTTVVPSDQITVNESSSGDINLKVDCNSGSKSSSGTSKNTTSIKTNINVNSNTH